MSKPSRRSRGSVTIEDVARDAGVSAMTVSRVINSGRTSATRPAPRCWRRSTGCSYSPNTAARSLAAGQATHIGLLYANPCAAYLSQFLVGALAGARRAGCHLVIEPANRRTPTSRREATRQLPRRPRSKASSCRRPCRNPQPILTELAQREIPVVTVAMGQPPRMRSTSGSTISRAARRR